MARATRRISSCGNSLSWSMGNQHHAAVRQDGRQAAEREHAADVSGMAQAHCSACCAPQAQVLHRQARLQAEERDDMVEEDGLVHGGRRSLPQLRH
jgi:hypothetical protein